MGRFKKIAGGIKKAAQRAVTVTKKTFQKVGKLAKSSAAKKAGNWAKNKWGSVKKAAQQASVKVGRFYQKNKKILAVVACPRTALLYGAGKWLTSPSGKKFFKKLGEGVRKLFKKPKFNKNKPKPPSRPKPPTVPPPPPLPWDQRNTVEKQRAEKSAKTNVRQQSKDTCALMSTRSILLEANGKAPDEAGMKKIGEQSGSWKDCEGSYNEASILSKAGIPATQYYKPTLSQIANAVSEGKAVIVGYDTRPVWGGRYLLEPKPAGHAVRVTGAERDKNGNIVALWINDTGDGVAPKRVSVDIFLKALNGFNGGRVAISNQPVFPAMR